MIEGFVKPEAPADIAMTRIFEILSAAYAWR
jgi:hypothetical protein